MTKTQIPEVLDELRSQETYARNDAIKRIIKEKINDEKIITALKEVTENDHSMSVRNFARSALNVFGVEHSVMEEEEVIYNIMTASPIRNEPEPRQELDETTLDTSSKTNLLTAIGIGLFVGFIGTAFIMNLLTYWTSFMASLVNGAIGSIFGMIGSVTGYAFSGSKRAVWIGAIIGTVVIPGCSLFAWRG